MPNVRMLAFGCLPMVLALLAGCGGGDDNKKYVSIGTGSVSGVYYPVGGAIAKLVTAGQDQHGVNVSVQSTGGSVFNINAVLSGDMEFGVAQADRQYQAYKGLAEWSSDGPQGKLRAVCSLHGEAVTLVAAVDAGIESLTDLKGKTVSLGAAASGSRANALDVLKAAGLDPARDLTAEELDAGEVASKLQDGAIDAFFYTVGHPNATIETAAAGRKRRVRVVPITGMDPLLADRPYYSVTEIPAYSQAADAGPTPSIGMVTTIVTSADVPDDVVYTVTRELFTHLDEFRKAHSALTGLTAAGMLKGCTAPLHPGAERYFREAGLIK